MTVAAPVNLRRSEFLMVVESLFDDQWILYSAFTSAMEVVSTARLHQLEAAIDNPAGHLEDAEWLADRGFLVRFDERKHLKQRYMELREQARREPGGLSLTIAPTVRCNFACTYCFEKHPERDLSESDTVGLAKFAASRLKRNTFLYVTWFGGEPLLRFRDLERTYEALKQVADERECEFAHHIITNGSLLKGERLDFLERTKCAYAQVTIDGPPAIHDNRRWTSGKQGTYEIIMQNLEAAAGTRIPVQLRINVDRRNCGHLGALLDDLEARGLKNRLYTYLGHTEGFTDEGELPKDAVLSREEFAQVEFEFEMQRWQRGFSGPPPLGDVRVGTICSADNPNGYVVSPGGALFDCWNETALDPSRARQRFDKNGVLHVNDESPQRDWTRYDPFAHAECQRCPVQPLCKGGCPWESAKHPPHLTGNCTPLRWTLADKLRAYHLSRSMDKHVSGSARSHVP